VSSTRYKEEEGIASREKTCGGDLSKEAKRGNVACPTLKARDEKLESSEKAEEFKGGKGKSPRRGVLVTARSAENRFGGESGRGSE